MWVFPMKKPLHLVVWFVIVLMAGAVGHHFFNVGFWIGALIAGVASIVNGLIAEWEDGRCDRDP